MQLEVTGDSEGPVGTEEADLFTVVSYTLVNGEFVVRVLNTDLINKDLADTAALQAAFAANRDDPGLFLNPGQSWKLSEGPDNFPEKRP